MYEDVDWDEMNGGLPLRFRTYPDSQPERTPEMKDHQVWVWLWDSPPRWEIRGTGVIIDGDNRTARTNYRRH